jgi:hypothetical protein
VRQRFSCHRDERRRPTEVWATLKPCSEVAHNSRRAATIRALIVGAWDMLFLRNDCSDITQSAYAE